MAFKNYILHYVQFCSSTSEPDVYSGKLGRYSPSRSSPSNIVAITDSNVSSPNETIEYYDSDEDLPIYERISANKRRLYSVEDIASILLNPNLDSSSVVCKKVPTSICESVSFIIDLKSLENQDDILSDDL
jgi:hypothetical protein